MIVTLFDGTIYPIIEGTRLVFSNNEVYLRSVSLEGEEVLVTVNKNDIEFIYQ